MEVIRVVDNMTTARRSWQWRTLFLSRFAAPLAASPLMTAALRGTGAASAGKVAAAGQMDTPAPRKAVSCIRMGRHDAEAIATCNALAM
jgi:hypothetical protein